MGRNTGPGTNWRPLGILKAMEQAQREDKGRMLTQDVKMVPPARPVKLAWGTTDGDRAKLWY